MRRRRRRRRRRRKNRRHGFDQWRWKIKGGVCIEEKMGVKLATTSTTTSSPSPSSSSSSYSSSSSSSLSSKEEEKRKREKERKREEKKWDKSTYFVNKRSVAANSFKTSGFVLPPRFLPVLPRGFCMEGGRGGRGPRRGGFADWGGGEEGRRERRRRRKRERILAHMSQ